MPGSAGRRPRRRLKHGAFPQKAATGSLQYAAFAFCPFSPPGDNRASPARSAAPVKALASRSVALIGTAVSARQGEESRGRFFSISARALSPSAAGDPQLPATQAINEHWPRDAEQIGGAGWALPQASSPQIR